VSHRSDNLFVAVPELPHGLEPEAVEKLQRLLLDDLIANYEIQDSVLWYYTPMMLSWSGHVRPLAIVYDCMDELSAFRGAPPELITREADLFSLADLVFTGGQSLYEAKRDLHPNVYAFPSSIDVEHFSKAKNISEDQPDQQDVPRPRIGYVGVIDERLDIGLLGQIAELKPEWHFVMVGPVVKISEADLPRPDNIHYLGSKSYEELPAYIAGWDVTMMPFAINESTRFISPTKTPEYLAAGKSVVSTPIRDVVRPYGENGLVHIASTPEEFVQGIELALTESGEDRMAKADEFLSTMSWNNTFREMSGLIDAAIEARGQANAKALGSVGQT
jgi:UDP-galactopyranose mutase